MGSRLKEKPDKTFYWFFEAECPISRDKDPDVLFQFPQNFSDEESLQSLPRFCFPYDIQRVKETVAVQHFTFVLTDLEGCQRFGFCRLTSESQTCLCILSYLPWFEVFYKLLNSLADYLTKGQTNEMRELLVALYNHPLPLANESVALQLGDQMQIRTEVPRLCGQKPLSQWEQKEGIPYFIAPDPKALPSIPESRNLTEFVVAVHVGNILQLYASMLFERRILISCSKLSTLTACVHACSGILFPMYWQHIFIPVLPPHLLDYCCAPMPYLIGVHSSLTERVRNGTLDEVVVLNVDTNTLETPFDDLKRIPSDVLAALKMRLKKQASFPGPGVARAFLRAQAVLFGGYRDALQCPEGGPVSFSEELFLTHKSQSMRDFLENAVHLQFFKQFIDARLEQLNQCQEPDDLFEEEIQRCRACGEGSKSYQQWVGNLKKGGGALILTVKSKATMCKAVKFQTKYGLRNLLTSKDQSDRHTLQRGSSISGTHTYRRVQLDSLQSRLPITQHFGKSRPRRPIRIEHQGEEHQGEEPWEQAGGNEEQVCMLDGELQGEVGLDLLCDPGEMDLLGEIFEALSSQSSTEQGQLYTTRSLDLFGPDSTDFHTHRNLATPSQESLSLSIGHSGSLLSWEEGLEESVEEEGEEPDNKTSESEEGEGPDNKPSESEEGEGPDNKPSESDGGVGLWAKPASKSEGLREEPEKIGNYFPNREDAPIKITKDEPHQQRVWKIEARTETRMTDQEGKEIEGVEGEKGGFKTPDDQASEQTNAGLSREQECCILTQRDAPQSGREVKTSSPDRSAGGGTAALSQADPGAEEEDRQTQHKQDQRKEEKSSPLSSPSVLSAVTLFQAKASTRASPDAHPRDPLNGPCIQASPRGASVCLQPHRARSPISSSTPPLDFPTQEEASPPVKVSELKKRFEM